MPQSLSTTRIEDRKRFKRYEPSWPPNVLTPASPHAHRGEYCGPHDCVQIYDQMAIDQSRAIPPVEPETRADKLRELMGELDPDTDWNLIIRLRREIHDIERLIEKNAGHATVYKPDPRLKGGKGK